MRGQGALVGLAGAAMSGLLVLGFTSVAVGQETVTQPASKSGISEKMCKKLIKQGYGVKCVKREVTYGATCKKKQHMYIGRCWVAPYQSYTQCLCYGSAYDGKWYWNAPE